MINKNTKTCPVCSKEIVSSANFCLNCGFNFNKYKSVDFGEKKEKDEFSKVYTKQMLKENRGVFIYIALVLIVVIFAAGSQILPFVIEDFSLKNPVILYCTATIIYLIDLYTFQFKKKFQKSIYFMLLIISIAYSVFFFIMIFRPEDGFIGLIGPLLTIIMILSPFIIGRKNLSIRG